MSVDTKPALRFGTHLSADGKWAAGPRLDDDRVTLELWRRGPRRLDSHPTGLPIDPSDQLMPAGDRLLICASQGQTHNVRSVATDGTPTEVAQLTGRAVRLINPAATDPDRRPWSLRFDSGRTALARVPGDTVLELDGAYSGGIWLSPDLLALGHSDSGPASAVQVDIGTGTVTSLFHVTARSNDEVQAYAPTTDLVVVHTDAGGTERLGYAHTDRSWAFPEALSTPDGLVEALGVDPTGALILAHIRRGVRSLLRVFDVATGLHRDLDVPPGTLAGSPSWTAGGLTVPWTAPGVPIEFLCFGSDLAATDRARTDLAQVVTVPGADGPIEAIAYGGVDWLHKPRLVLALHGGPLGAWRLAFDPMLERIADGDTAVLAINQRGSVGYGYAFAAAIRRGWGGVDLDDVIAVGRHLAAARGGAGGLALFGASYGAFLALVAACVEPQLWHRCAVLSAFSSPVRLAACAPPAVRAGIEQTGGLSGAPRDLLELGRQARAQMLLVHGAYDESIPVAHARELAVALGPRARYLEIPNVGHDLGWPHVWDLVCDFLAQADHPTGRNAP